jgi:hypothetical protein
MPGLLDLNDDDLAKMPWVDLISLRNKMTAPDQQEKIAPYEHRAYARENTNSPLDALQMALLVPGYQGYKLLRSFNPASRTSPSWKQLQQGLLGTWEGLNK